MKKKKKKIIFILLLFLITYIISFSITVKVYFKNNDALTQRLLNNNYHYHIKDKIITKLISFILDINLSKSLTLINNNYVSKIKNTSSDEEKDIETIEVIKQVNETDNSDFSVNSPIVYLYNTHQSQAKIYLLIKFRSKFWEH